MALRIASEANPAKIMACGCNSMAECRLSKPDVEGSTPFTRSELRNLQIDLKERERPSPTLGTLSQSFDLKICLCIRNCRLHDLH